MLELHALSCRVIRGVAAERHERKLAWGELLTQTLCNLGSAYAWHGQIYESDLRASFVRNLNSIVTTIGDSHLLSHALQQKAQHVRYVWLIVYD